MSEQRDKPFPETYLGDGLYASFDGYQVILRAPRTDGDHWVALEPPVLATFLSWLKVGRTVPSDA